MFAIYLDNFLHRILNRQFQVLLHIYTYLHVSKTPLTVEFLPLFFLFKIAMFRNSARSYLDRSLSWFYSG